MTRSLPLAAALALALAAPSTPRAEPPAGGRIESDLGRFEILGRPLRAGDRIELPEGYLVVEESAPDDGQIGSFGVVSAEAFAPAAAESPATPDASAPADAAPGAPSCRAERTAYLAELWHEAGIDVDDPTALLEGLQAGATGPSAGFWWFANATDAFRPLAWSYELRRRADALGRCVRGD